LDFWILGLLDLRTYSSPFEGGLRGMTSKDYELRRVTTDIGTFGLLDIRTFGDWD